MFVDESYRRLSARIHSAGHLLDMAVRRAGRTDLKPGKGYHFPTSPYVEYIGAVDAKEK
jgi:Ser-tRNA(Ala) deacylase AlaX